MNSGWNDLSAAELQSLAAALRSGRLSASPSAMALQDYCAPRQAEWLASALGCMQADAATLSALLDLLGAERARVDNAVRAVDLVWTGPEVEGLQSRDTGAVVRELFGCAERSVLVAGYAIHRGREVFATLAERMRKIPALQVWMVVDIPRRNGDTTIEADLVSRYAADFSTRNWPGERMPEVFYDRRGLAFDSLARSAMHAKVVVVDQEVALITSANFTTAAQTKNIEVGTLLRMPHVAGRLHNAFKALVSQGQLLPLPFPRPG